MITWLVFLAAAAGTYAWRASLLVGLAGRQLPPALQSRLALVGPAAIATLMVSAVLPASGGGGVVWPELLAGVGGFVAVRRTGKVTHAFVVGMPLLWGFTAVGLG